MFEDFIDNLTNILRNYIGKKSWTLRREISDLSSERALNLSENLEDNEEILNIIGWWNQIKSARIQSFSEMIL